MKCLKQGVWLIAIGQLLVQAVGQTSGLVDSDSEEAQEDESSKQQQQGSWSHWWSYDGISGPDYWNINKRWRLCSLGRKQSPIVVQTSRLVYDHLLGPIQLSWLPGGSTSQLQLEQLAAMKTADRSQSQDASQTPGGVDDSSSSSESQRPVKVQLLNSGRGIEVWLEGSPVAQRSKAAGSGGGSSKLAAAEDQLILSRGPLSYAYKLFKIELHSAAVTTTTRTESGPRTDTDDGGGSGHNDNELADHRRSDNEDQDESASLPEALKSGKSSEHLIDGRAFDGELQLHFYNRHLASSASEAQHLVASDGESRPNLFAAISVFLARRPKSSPSPSSSSSAAAASPIDFMLDNLSAIQNQGSFIELQLSRRHLEALVPNKRHYVTYQGSLNRPPCAESVDWILINQALLVDADKFGALFERLNTNQENIRPVKPLNRRLLRTTINNVAVRAPTTTSPTKSLTLASAGSCSPVASSPASTFVGEQSNKVSTSWRLSALAEPVWLHHYSCIN